MDELLHHDNNPLSEGSGVRKPPYHNVIEKCLAAGRAAKEAAFGAFGAVRAWARRMEDAKAQKEARAAGEEKAPSALAKLKLAVAKHPVSPLLYVAVIAIASGVFLFRSTYIQAYAVSLDGVEVALVADEADMEQALSNVEKRVAQVVGEYEYPAVVTYTPVYSSAGELTDVQAIEDYLYEAAGAVMDGYVLTVGGQEIGAGGSEADLQAQLDRVAAQYRTENTVEYGFVDDVSIVPRQMASDTQFDMEGIFAALTANSVEEAVYVVEKGDTFSHIAKELGISIDMLSDLNPDVVIDKIWVGDELVVQQSVPLLSVWTLDNVTYEQTIESPIEYIDTEDMYKGETKVVQQGEDGLAQVNANVRYVNGYETEQTVLSTTVIQEATTTQILRGTKSKPKTASKGTYIWPVSGRITSRFGYRHGEFHTGLDIAVSTGTTVKAADGGTVSYAGRRGNYGKLVIITHDNGAQTYYAHNSALLVSVGDKVYQGQAIARSGSTGRSTGPHCHFEIRINGQTKNPLNYL